jgi:hypothetical protein
VDARHKAGHDERESGEGSILLSGSDEFHKIFDLGNSLRW